MRVAVLGAQEGVGRLLVDEALRRGHDVAVLAAPGQPGPPPGGHGATEVAAVPGHELDGGAVSDLVHGCDAVLDALADVTGGDPSLAAAGTLNAIRSMQRYGVRRLVVLSSSEAAPRGEAGAAGPLRRLVRPLARRQPLDTLRRMEISVRQSELDWTLVRASRLADGSQDGRLRVGPGYALPNGRPAGRAAVAAFMLDELERGDNAGHAVAVAG